MVLLNFAPFDKKEFIEKLQNSYTDAKVKKGFDFTTSIVLLIRKKNFTITNFVDVRINPKKGTVKVKTRYDEWPIWLFLFGLVGIYILIKKDKMKKLEAEAVEKITAILGNSSI